jgi:hypothetical protein
LTDKTANTQTEPKRIQRKRSKGWRMPPNTVYVGRPTRWGNPVEVTEVQTRDKVVEAFKRWLAGIWGDGNGLAVAKAAAIELRGKDLACWCHLCDRHKDGKPFGEHCDECAPCHADITGEIANAKESL